MTKRALRSDKNDSRENALIKKLRRTKTGCLTCRTRRVKCDERKPVCERCESANLECSGYEGKRRLPLQRSPHKREEPMITESRSSSFVGRIEASPNPVIRADGLPLIGLPVNPSPSQRPHTRARDILAYNQFLYRTWPIVFPFDKDHVWRDYLCEAAWEVEYVYDAIVALGSMHRATLLLSRECKNDQHRGLDTKVIALQAYTRAFQDLAEQLANDQASKVLVVGVLVLFAYFESFDGNIPAAIRHNRMAHHYFNEVYSDGTYHQNHRIMQPLISALNELDLTSCVVMPLPSAIDPNPPSHAHSHMDLFRTSNAVSTSSAPLHMLHYLLDIASADFKIKQLIWSPVIGHLEDVPTEKVLAFDRLLEDWRKAHERTFQNFQVEDLQKGDFEFTLENLDNLQFPPDSHPTLSRDHCLAFGLYAFYRGRLAWKLSLLNYEASQNEIKAYQYFYQVLRFYRTYTESPADIGSTPALTCEALGLSITPMLFLIGHCCPNPSWLQWIIHQLNQLSREGLYSPCTFSKNLQFLLSLEKCVKQYSGSRVVERFSVSSARILAMPLPDASGRKIVSYYAQPQSSGSLRRGQGKQKFYPLCVATWACSESPPTIETYDGMDQPFDEDWLLDQPLVREWVDWSHVSGFDLDQALRDHINGSELLSREASDLQYT